MTGDRPGAPWWVRAAAFGLAAGAGFGIPGLVGAGLTVAVHRTRAEFARTGVVVGAGLVGLAAVVQIVTSYDAWGTVSSSVPSATMWPHWIGVVGLVLALGAAWHEPEPAAQPSTSEEQP